MNPGRELDALVAEKVMGLLVSRDSAWERAYEQEDDLVETTQDRRLRRTLQPYSTDIAAAWEVVEKLELLDRGWQLCQSQRGWGIGHSSVGDEWDWVVRAKTAPHVICLAALKAVGHEFEG